MSSPEAQDIAARTWSEVDPYRQLGLLPNSFAIIYHEEIMYSTAFISGIHEITLKQPTNPDEQQPWDNRIAIDVILPVPQTPAPLPSPVQDQAYLGNLLDDMQIRRNLARAAVMLGEKDNSRHQAGTAEILDKFEKLDESDAAYALMKMLQSMQWEDKNSTILEIEIPPVHPDKVEKMEVEVQPAELDKYDCEFTADYERRTLYFSQQNFVETCLNFGIMTDLILSGRLATRHATEFQKALFQQKDSFIGLRNTFQLANTLSLPMTRMARQKANRS